MKIDASVVNGPLSVVCAQARPDATDHGLRTTDFWKRQ